MQKTIKEIVEETVAFYEEDPSRRAVTVFGCAYLTEEGNRCAVGRYMREDVDAASLEGTCYNICPINDYRTRYAVDELLKEEYRGHPVDFWRELQRWHDSPTHWEGSLASKEDRQQEINRILERYSNPTN